MGKCILTGFSRSTGVTPEKTSETWVRSNISAAVYPVPERGDMLFSEWVKTYFATWQQNVTTTPASSSYNDEVAWAEANFIKVG